MHGRAQRSLLTCLGCARAHLNAAYTVHVLLWSNSAVACLCDRTALITVYQRQRMCMDVSSNTGVFTGTVRQMYQRLSDETTPSS